MTLILICGDKDEIANGLGGKTNRSMALFNRLGLVESAKQLQTTINQKALYFI